jgi:hypothetical protein
VQRLPLLLILPTLLFTGCEKSTPDPAPVPPSNPAALAPSPAVAKPAEPPLLFEQQSIFTATVLAAAPPASEDYQSWTVDADGSKDLRLRIDKISAGDPPFVHDENVVFKLRELPAFDSGGPHRFLLSHGVSESGEAHVRVHAADAGSPTK